jgi:hypothetical protein
MYDPPFLLTLIPSEPTMIPSKQRNAATIELFTTFILINIIKKTIIFIIFMMFSTIRTFRVRVCLKRGKEELGFTFDDFLQENFEGQSCYDVIPRRGYNQEELDLCREYVNLISQEVLSIRLVYYLHHHPSHHLNCLL